MHPQNDVVTFGFKWLFEAHNICDDRCKNPSRDGSVHIVYAHYVSNILLNALLMSVSSSKNFLD